MTNYKKVLLELPVETADELVVAYGTGNRAALLSYVVALREGGWTFESMAKPLGISRERIRQLYNEVLPYETGLALAEAQRLGFVVPERPRYAEKVKHTPKPVDPEVLERLLELKPYAERVRANSGRFRAEGEEYGRLLNSQREAGVTVYQLAKALDVTNAAIRSRLVRYGYLKTGSTAKAYTPIRTANRV